MLQKKDGLTKHIDLWAGLLKATKSQYACAAAMYALAARTPGSRGYPQHPNP